MRWNREVDRAIVSRVAETEIQQIKKEYISDRISKSIDLFSNQPERYGNIIMRAVAVLAMLVSKVLQKTRELSAKRSDIGMVQPITEPSSVILDMPQTEKTPKPTIPPKPVMSDEAALYPRLLKIYKELNRQNGIIFDTERERNNLEIERDSLKGFAKLTKKGELQGRIDHKNEEIDLLKVGLSGIARRYGFRAVQDFYKSYAAAKTAYAEYRDKGDRWEERCCENAQKQKKESVYKRLQNY